jgi:hypothetical protein
MTSGVQDSRLRTQPVSRAQEVILGGIPDEAQPVDRSIEAFGRELSGRLVAHEDEEGGSTALF